VSHVFKKPLYMDPEGSLPCSQHPATCPSPEHKKSNFDLIS